MPYAIKEIYYTLQGEGYHTGRPAVFLRFSGCNLWNGLEDGRNDAICKFCDTDFFGVDGRDGGQYQNPQELAAKVDQIWAASDDRNKFVVCTGGEPTMQLDEGLIDALHGLQFEVAVETNGTIEPAQGIDWITVSPKALVELIVRKGDELKLVYPQAGIQPANYLGLDFDRYYLQPMDGDELELNTSRVIKYCLDNAQWRLSIQTHKVLGID
ncbi:7-carboxy-7-deazaguanine synthase [Candidatus Neomarinimicrobiota bacterium]